jgi:hypothetical protein
VENICALTKVDGLPACFALRVVGAVFVIFPPALAYKLHSPPANGKLGPNPLRNVINPADE